MGEVDADLEHGGGGCTDLGPYIIGSGAVVPVVRVRDVGDDALLWEGDGPIPPQGGPQTDRKAT